MQREILREFPGPFWSVAGQESCFQNFSFSLTEFTLKGSSGVKEGETQNGHKPALGQRCPGARRRGPCFEFPSSFGNFYVILHLCENFSLEKQSTFRIAAYFYVYSKQVGFNRAPLNPTCCEISAEPNFRYTAILSRVLSTSVLNQLVFGFSSAEPNCRYTMTFREF